MLTNTSAGTVTNRAGGYIKGGQYGVVVGSGGTVTNEVKPADLTLTISLADLVAMAEGKLDAMTAVMGGKLQLSDMGLAMSLQSKMQALFSRMS